MTSPNLIAFKTEVAEGIVGIEPHIRGLEDLSKHVMSEDARAHVLADLTRYRALRDRLVVTLESLESLEAESFPDVPNAQVPQPILAELSNELHDVSIAVMGFGATPMASRVEIALGGSSPKPEE
jgi:hypothetical protein